MFEFIESCLRHKSEMVIYRVTHEWLYCRVHRELSASQQ